MRKFAQKEPPVLVLRYPKKKRFKKQTQDPFPVLKKTGFPVHKEAKKNPIPVSKTHTKNQTRCEEAVMTNQQEPEEVLIGLQLGTCPNAGSN
jgi:hypothetical protein